VLDCDCVFAVRGPPRTELVAVDELAVVFSLLDDLFEFLVRADCVEADCA